jgi:hypothetical protein
MPLKLTSDFDGDTVFDHLLGPVLGEAHLLLTARIL